jgi:hypothetical protein
MFKKARARFLNWLRDAELDNDPRITDVGVNEPWPPGGLIRKHYKQDSGLGGYLRSFSMVVTPGQGGIAITSTVPGNEHDDAQTSLYLITDDKDLATEIAHIITMQAIKGTR